MAQEFMNNCLVCGEPQTGKTTLLEKFITNVDWKSTENKSIRTCQWEAANKYYQANVNFFIINNVDSISQIPNSNIQALLLFINLNQTRVCIYIVFIYFLISLILIIEQIKKKYRMKYLIISHCGIMQYQNILQNMKLIHNFYWEIMYQIIKKLNQNQK